MKSMTQFLGRNKLRCFLVSISLIIQIAGTLLVPFLIAVLIDEGIASSNQQLIIDTGYKMLFVAIGSTISAIVGSYLSANLAALYGFEVRQKLYAKVQDFSIQDVETVGVTSLLTRMTNDVTNIQRSLVMIIQLILPAPIICIFAVFMTYLNSPKLALLPLLSITIYLLVVGYLFKKGLPLSSTIQVRLDRIMVKLREFFNGISMIRAFDNQDLEESITNNRFTDYGESMIKVNKIFAFLSPVAYLLMGLVFALIVWSGGILVGTNQLQIGVVTAVIEYSVLTLAYLIMAAMVIVTLPLTYSSLLRIQTILDTDHEIKDYDTSKEKLDDTSPIFAEFKHVRFAYKDSEPVLDDITFQIKRGQTTAIVGGTGSGKSTIAKVLLKLATISAGEIIINGEKISEIAQADLRNKISYIPQKAFLFSGNIESNLRMGNPLASIQEIEKAVEIAQGTDFIANLDDGYQAFVSQGGTNFSGGQRQRLSIARALVKHADLFIFDDSFSALDYQTDANLRRALKEEMSTATFLIVAQRLSTIQDADHIIVLNDGRIVGQGSHEELLAENLTYREFAVSQGFILQGGSVNGK